MKKSKLLMLLSVLVLSLSSCNGTLGESNHSSSESSQSSSETSSSEETIEETTPSEGGEENPGGDDDPEKGEDTPTSYTYSISVTNLAELTSFNVGDSKEMDISLFSDNPAYSGVSASTENVSILIDNAYMSICGFTLTATYPGEVNVSLSWVEDSITLASTSFSVEISGETKEYVYNAVLSFSISYGGVNQTVPSYAEAYVIGSWNSWSPTKLEESNSREGGTTYEVSVDALKVNETYEYQLVLLYEGSDPSLISEDELYDHRLTSTNQSFSVHADNEDGYVYNLVVNVDSTLESIIPQKTFSDVSITFHIYMHDDTEYEEELEPLDSEYATLYIYGFTGEEFAACSVVDNHYVLHLDSIEAGTYKYSALLYYANQELPEVVDSDFWDAHKVNDGPYGGREGDEEYIIDGSFINDGASVDAYFFAGTPLIDLVPDQTVYTKKNVTVNFYITLSGTSTRVTPIEYGTLYIYGLTGDEFAVATPLADDPGMYSLTIPEIDAGTYKYSALIYYSDEDLPDEVDSEFWGQYKVNTGEYGGGLGDEELTIDKSLIEDGGTIYTSFSAIKDLGEILEDLRIYEGDVSITFNIKAYGSDTSETALEYGTLYIYGLTGSEFAACEIESGEYVLHLDSLRAGTYQYSALIYYSDEDLPDVVDTDFWNQYKVNDGAGNRQGDETLEVSYEELSNGNGQITASFTACQPLSEILPKKVSTLTLEFHMWYNQEAYEQYALSYMTCYFYSYEYDEDNFIKCYINEGEDGNHYAVNLEGLKPGEYSYSLILLYNDSEITPDPSEESIWDYKINDGEYGMGVGNNYFTILGDEDSTSPLQIDLACRYHLSDKFPNNATITNYTLSFTILDSESNALSCPEYGDIYIVGSWDQEIEFNIVTSSETTHTYVVNELTLDKEYELSLVFVYKEESPNWDHKITDDDLSFTPSESEGSTHEFTINLESSLEDMFPVHDETNLLTDYTISFDIYKESEGAKYVQKTNVGASVFLNGNVPGANWNEGEDPVFLMCTYDESIYGSDHPVYTITFSEIYVGTYSYKLVLNDTNYPGWYNEITEDNMDLVVSLDQDVTHIIEIESAIWFDSYWPGY